MGLLKGFVVLIFCALDGLAHALYLDRLFLDLIFLFVKLLGEDM